MSVTGPAAEFRQLAQFRKRAEKQFLSPYLASSPVSAPSSEEELAVAAFAVLLHGALENYAEGLCLWLATRVEQSWLTKQRISKATASLLLSVKPPPATGTATALFDRLRLALEQAKADRSGAVAKNNGIELEHLKDLLEPLGVLVPSDPVRVASLELLVSLRHQWAHQYRFSARKTKSAGDMRTIADDCVAIAKELASTAAALRA